MRKESFLTVLLVLALAMVWMSAARGQAAAAKPAGEAQLAIIDTDIGDDIDDAFALALALRSPELHLLGVTTAYGDTELRARLLDRYLAAVGRSDLPVAVGVATPHTNVFTQAAYAEREPDRKHPDAVDFLLEQIRKYPGQITLIGIGPLFNVQAAIERDPATFRKLKRVVIMGGSVYHGYDGGVAGIHRPPEPEWNIDRDPAGARALLASGVPVYMMPLDSTQIRLEKPEREMIFAHGSALTDQLTLLYHQWLAASPGKAAVPVLFDAVAVTYAVRPELCPAKALHIDVDEKGLTLPGPGAPNAHVCLESNEGGFLDLLLARVVGN